MSKIKIPYSGIHNQDIFGNGGLFDHPGGHQYSPPPPPVPFSNLLLESGFRILLENGDYIALES